MFKRRKPTLTRAQSREIDRLAMNELRIPGVVLMENAGRSATDVICDMLTRRQVAVGKARVAIVCGGGNNGGDGYVIARHLQNRGATVACFAVRDPGQLTGDALTHATIALCMGIDIVPFHDVDAMRPHTSWWQDAHVVVDAVLGTGFSGEVREPAASAIHHINQAGTWNASVVAVDVPSGLDCDKGTHGQCVVRADATVTFVTQKVGFSQPMARATLGEVTVADIGAPDSLIARAIASARS